MLIGRASVESSLMELNALLKALLMRLRWAAAAAAASAASCAELSSTGFFTVLVEVDVVVVEVVRFTIFISSGLSDGTLTFCTGSTALGGSGCRCCTGFG